MAEPLTLDRLYAVPIQDAANLAVGPQAHDYVERSPFNGILPNYVLNTVNLFGLSFYKRAESVGPGTCRVFMARAVFEVDGIQDIVASSANGDTPYGQRALKLRSHDEAAVYFAAGTAPSTPLTPGGPDQLLTPQARTSDSCSNPVSGRTLFEAASPEAAVAAVTSLKTAVLAAGSSGRLRFKLSGVCADGPCRDARRTLSTLKPQRITGLDRPPCRALDAHAVRCRTLWVAAGGDGDAEWLVTLNEDAKGRLRSVRLEYEVLPVV